MPSIFIAPAGILTTTLNASAGMTTTSLTASAGTTTTTLVASAGITTTTLAASSVVSGGPLISSNLDLRPSQLGNYTGSILFGAGTPALDGSNNLYHLRVFPDGVSNTTGALVVSCLSWGSSAFPSTMVSNTNSTTFPFSLVFLDGHTFQFANSGITQLGRVDSFLSGPIYNNNFNTASSGGGHRGLRSSPTFSSTGGGTITYANAFGVESECTVNSGATITSCVGVNVNDATGAGAITTQYGCIVQAQTKGGTNIAFYSGTGLGANNYAFYDAGGAQSRFAGKFTTYNNIATAPTSIGIPAIYAESISGTLTANTTLLTYTPPATAGRYRICVVTTSTSGTNTGTVQVTMDYRTSQGTTRTGDIIPLHSAAGVYGTTGTGASVEFHGLTYITINNAAINIVLKLVVTGTVAATVACAIEQIA